jgi:iron complex outermembrane receptor protein
MVLAIAALLAAQSVARPVVVRHDGQPVAGASIECASAKTTTGPEGRATITVPADGCTLLVTREGLAPFSLPIKAEPQPIEVILDEAPDVEEAVVVTATRGGRLAADQALRVEVVAREEIEEKLLMTPGDIVMLLNETTGIRLQATSPALGGASVRIQGLAGRYTPVLTDGLPINSTQVASLGLLQIPPMDLRQVEVIKGAASALYGAAALGGVINLVTRPPGDERVRELLVNATSRGGADAIAWLAGPATGRWGYTLLAGVHTQSLADVDRDGWADVPRYRRVIVRPRAVFEGDGRNLDVRGGFTRESRTGGFADGRYVQSVDTTRADAGVVARITAGAAVVSVRASLSSVAHTHRYGADPYEDRHDALFGEVSLSRALGRHLLVLGGAVERQSYGNGQLPAFDYGWTIPGLFVQDDWTVHPRWTLSLSARADHHPEFGAFVSPRVSSLVRAAGWDVRGSIGVGFHAPTPLADEVDDVGLGRVIPPDDLKAERGVSVSVDATRRIGVVEMTGSVFSSRIEHALAVAADGDRLRLSSRPQPTRTSGAEIFARLRRGSVVVTASHAWTRATEVEPTGERDVVPLTPRAAWGVVAAWERHGRARIGVEIYRTGRQRLEDNLFAAESQPYTIVGWLAERRIGRYRLFVNFENLTGVRQSEFAPLIRPAPSATGRYTVDAWAPLDGRTVNAGVWIRF